jgi:hypothetical protein
MLSQEAAGQSVACNMVVATTCVHDATHTAGQLRMYCTVPGCTDVLDDAHCTTTHCRNHGLTTIACFPLSLQLSPLPHTYSLQQTLHLQLGRTGKRPGTSQVTYQRNTGPPAGRKQGHPPQDPTQGRKREAQTHPPTHRTATVC